MGGQRCRPSHQFMADVLEQAHAANNRAAGEQRDR
jgi:hypothetical protein